MAVSGTPSSGNDTLTGDNANDTIIGQQGDDSIAAGGGDDVVLGDVRLSINGALDSDQTSGWSIGTVDGWTNANGGGIERWADGFLGLPTYDGSAFIELDANANGGAPANIDHIQTEIALDTGVTYTLTFGHAARPSAINDDFEVVHNGTVIATISPSSTFFFSYSSVTLTGLSGTDTIGFREIAGQDNGLGPLLDNVQISLTPSSAAASGFSYDDTIDGGAGNDSLYGQEGDDRIIGGLGTDYMQGGIGADVFVATDGDTQDIIGDFVIGEDMLDVLGLDNGSGGLVQTSDVTLTSDGQGGSILTFPNGEQIILRGIDPSLLDSDAALEAIGIPCFVAGTRIATPNGNVPVENLKEGDLVLRHSDKAGDSARVLRVFRRDLSARDLIAMPTLRPVRITQGALGNGLPARDLLVSRQHRMLVSSVISKRMFGSDEVLLPAIRLAQFDGIHVDTTLPEVSYYHVLLEQHDVIFAESAPTESLLTGTEAMKTLSIEAQIELQLLFPELRHPSFTPCPARPIPDRRRQKQLVARHLKNRKPPLDGLHKKKARG